MNDEELRKVVGRLLSRPDYPLIATHTCVHLGESESGTPVTRTHVKMPAGDEWLLTVVRLPGT